MSDDSLDRSKLRAWQWMNAIHAKRGDYAAGVEGAMRTIRAASDADTQRQREIAELEAVWELPCGSE